MNTSTALTIHYQPITALGPYPRNARTHSKRQIRQIADSIQAFGFVNPALVDRNNQIIAGHGRVEAAKLLSLHEVPTIALEELTEDQIRAYIIADNKLAENAGWDNSILAIELQHLISIENLGFDVTVTGLEIPQIDIVIGDANQPAGKMEEAVDLGSHEPPISQPGDLWQLGTHRVFCGSCLEDRNYQALLEGASAAAIFTDPPYNVKIDGHATGNGMTRHREFAMASGEMTETEFQEFLNSACTLMARYSTPHSVHYVCMDWRHLQALLAAGSAIYKQLLNVCVWVKDNGGMGSFYRSQHELVAVFRNGKETHRNNVQLGRFGRNRTNVWQYPGVQTRSKQAGEGNLLSFHPTVKPTKMVADAILDCTKRRDIVLDPFLGSGTTLLAAEQTGRICCGMEIDPSYVDLVIRRWQKQTGGVAVHTATKRSFEDVAKERTTVNEHQIAA